MQYFVAFKDTNEVRWQVELLYESIRLLDLSDQFLVSINHPVKKHIYPNIIYCKKVESAHLEAIEKGFLKNPFVVLSPHSFVINKTSLEEIPLISNSCGGIVNYGNEIIVNSIDFSFNMPLPFKTILNLPVINQPNVVILQTIVRSWLNSNLTRWTPML